MAQQVEGNDVEGDDADDHCQHLGQPGHGEEVEAELLGQIVHGHGLCGERRGRFYWKAGSRSDLAERTAFSVLRFPILRSLQRAMRSRAMNHRFALTLSLCGVLLGGCADLGSLGGPQYGETAGAAASQAERDGTIAKLENIQVDDKYKLGVGTAVGAVAGGLLGAGVGDSTGATVAGAVLGGAAGTYAESKVHKQDAQRVTVNMKTGGTVTIVQPMDGRLREGMAVRVEGSGESARVVPR